MSKPLNQSARSQNNQIAQTSSGFDYATFSSDDLNLLFKQKLNEGIHGLCFSAYEEGQKPSDQLTEEQVKRRMSQMANYTKWTRSFSCIEGNELIPKIAKEYGIQTIVGAWLSDDLEQNEQEIEALIQLAQDGYVDIAAVGNEVLLRKDLNVNQLLEYINRVQQALPDIPVGYVDTYHEFTVYPELVDASDLLLINCYPFWEGSHINEALPHLQSMYQEALNVAKGKRVIISETGWPSQGTNFKKSEPSMTNFITYFLQVQEWAQEQNIETMYFTSFDESWKVGTEGDVGAYWGIWDKSEQFKV